MFRSLTAFTRKISLSGRGGKRLLSTASTAGDPDVMSIIQDHIRNGQEDAFYVVDLRQIENKHKEWQEELPDIEPFYAVKCNPDNEVLKTLADLGVNFDCASRGEFRPVLELGVNPERVLYANPCKQISHLREAAQVGVNWLTFDSAEELVKIAAYHPGAQLILRVLVDDSHSVCVLGTKFGAQLGSVPELVRLAQGLGLSLRGVSFHVGSGCYDARAYENAITTARSVVDIAAEQGVYMDVLDVGGGFPGTAPTLQLDTEGDEPGAKIFKGVSFAEIASRLRSAISAHFPTGFRVIAEPGRYYVAASHTLATGVIGRKTVGTGSMEPFSSLMSPTAAVAGPATTALAAAVAAGTTLSGAADLSYMYYINDGLYASFNCLLYDHGVVTPRALSLVEGGDDGAAEEEPVQQLFPSSVWGPTCDGMDCLTKTSLLPRMQPGQWLYFTEMGAYTAAAGSTFNGFDKPSKFYVPASISLQNQQEL